MVFVGRLDKGKGLSALMVIWPVLAREHGIPIYENPDLLTLLSQLDLGDEIPRPLYTAVAEVIAFAYILTGKIPENYQPEGRSDP